MCTPSGGFDCWDQLKSRSRMSPRSRLGFQNCWEFINCRDVLVETVSIETMSRQIETPGPINMHKTHGFKSQHNLWFQVSCESASIFSANTSTACWTTASSTSPSRSSCLSPPRTKKGFKVCRAKKNRCWTVALKWEVFTRIQFFEFFAWFNSNFCL